jgi:hypothetical protein
LLRLATAFRGALDQEAAEQHGRDRRYGEAAVSAKPKVSEPVSQLRAAVVSDGRQPSRNRRLDGLFGLLLLL